MCVVCVCVCVCVWGGGGGGEEGDSVRVYACMCSGYMCVGGMHV